MVSSIRFRASVSRGGRSKVRLLGLGPKFVWAEDGS